MPDLPEKKIIKKLQKKTCRICLKYIIKNDKKNLPDLPTNVARHLSSLAASPALRIFPSNVFFKIHKMVKRRFRNMDGDKKGENCDPDHLASSTENQNEVEFFPICLNTRSLPSNTVLQWQQVSDLNFD